MPLPVKAKSGFRPYLFLWFIFWTGPYIVGGVEAAPRARAFVGPIRAKNF